MASKTYEGRQAPPENNAKSCKAGTDAGARSVLICGNGDCGGGDDDSDADHEEEAVLKVESVDGEKKKKKRKRSKKKKTAVKGGLVQSSPPRVPVSELFPSGIYPRGETLAYTDDKTARTSGEEIRYLERFDYKFLEDYRQAAEVHRQVRQWTQQSVKPGQTLTEIAEGVEDSVRALLGNQGLGPGDGLKAGMGFPTGLCLNNCGAHFTPNPGAKEIILQKEDVMKIDFGVHINGRIVDSAFTVAFDPVYDNLLAAVKDATNTGVRVAGIDARMGEIGSSIQEVMESYEVEIKGKVFPVKAIRNIAGHNIKPYQIHGGKSVPFVKTSDDTKMEAGEVFAIETFGSTGRGYLRDDVGTYGYGKNFNTPKVNLRLSSAKSLLKTIDQNFGTLVFARRYLERLGINHYLAGMNELVSTGIVEEYAPLVDVKGSYVAQFEHTILLHDSGKEVISRGEDY